MQKYIFPEKQKKRKEVRHTTRESKMEEKTEERGRGCMTTLCYIEKDDSYLMMHRTVKKNDVNKDKWMASAAMGELGESQEECLLRERVNPARR